MSQYMASPRRGHLEQLYHIFAYQKKYNKSKIVLDDTYINWNGKFQVVDWKDHYPDAMEDIPPNLPEGRGNMVQINCFVDANHAGDMMTRRSHTGILLFVNNAPVD